MKIMKAVIQQIEGLALSAKSDSGHWIAMDADREVGGSDGASRPLELVLMGLGGCTGMDVISILKKMRVPLKRFEIVLDADRAEEHPRVFRRIRLEYRLFGDSIDPEKVEKAIEMSKTQYCSVSAMLSKAVPVEFIYRINPFPEK